VLLLCCCVGTDQRALVRMGVRHLSEMTWEGDKRVLPCIHAHLMCQTQGCMCMHGETLVTSLFCDCITAPNILSLRHPTSYLLTQLLSCCTMPPEIQACSACSNMGVHCRTAQRRRPWCHLAHTTSPLPARLLRFWLLCTWAAQALLGGSSPMESMATSRVDCF